MSDEQAAQKQNRGPAAAADNRRALIRAARELFAEQGFSVPFSTVARRAGVGQASLYRHFSDKSALGIAVFDENLQSLEGLELSLHEFLEAIASQARVSASLLEALVSTRSPAARELDVRLRALIRAILDREQLGRSVSVDDVATAVSMVAFHTASSPAEDAATRAIAIVEQGLLPR